MAAVKEALKSAAKAVRDSPAMLRRKLKGKRHAKLEDDWLNSKDAVVAGVTFYVKYLGTMTVEKAAGHGCTDDAVHRIVHQAKSRGQKLQKMSVTVTAKSIKLIDLTTQMRIDEMPIYKISYCTADDTYEKVFCFIAKDPETGRLQCHAFMCSKKSKAQAMCLTVAQSFNIAYEAWQDIKKRRAQQKANLERLQKENESAAAQPEAPAPAAVPEVTLTDGQGRRFSNFDFDEEDAHFDEEFTRLAEARSNPNLLEGIEKHDLGDDVAHFLKGESSPSDLQPGKSHEDLLDL
ncbi:low density lipoprotein receptor adapter protein 1-like [Oscarella lobularis]|uniref:low density lipoprotein receptor adapter protein 1-like n=1 Tax=Oscarella lobularis TaxID=121494 RepID=UPI003313264C